MLYVQADVGHEQLRRNKEWNIQISFNVELSH